MQEQSNKEFRELLMQAIGPSSKQDFAKRAGMVPQQLSRYLREDYKSKPSSSTLRKIADASGDPDLYDKLMRACGYGESQVMARKSKPFSERAKLNAKDLKEGLSELLKGPSLYPSIEDFMGAYELIFSTEDITEIGVYGKKESYNAKYPMAEYSVCVTTKFETPIKECFTWTALYFAETRSGKVVVVGAETDPKSIYEAGGIKEETYEQFKGEEFVYIQRMKKGIDSKEAVLKAIFGDFGDEYPYTYVGFGFYLPEPPKKLKVFLKDHKDAFCTSEELEKVYEEAVSGDPVKVLENYSDPYEIGTGYIAAIAKIMEAETDLPFMYLNPELDIFPDNVPCIMIEGAVDADGGVSDEYLLEDLIEICREYASELGLKKFGEVHLQTMQKENNNHIYNV